MLETSLTPLPICGNRPLHSDCAKRSDLKLTVWHSDSRHSGCLDSNSDITPSAGSPHSIYALSPNHSPNPNRYWEVGQYLPILRPITKPDAVARPRTRPVSDISLRRR